MQILQFSSNHASANDRGQDDDCTTWLWHWGYGQRYLTWYPRKSQLQSTQVAAMFLTGSFKPHPKKCFLCWITEYEYDFGMSMQAVIVAIVGIGSVFPSEVFMDHKTGCYHLFFPVSGIRVKPQPETIDEGLFSPQSLVAHSASDRIGIRLSAGAHYIERVLVDPGFGGEIRPYAFADDNDLRSLPSHETASGGDTPTRRSAFDSAGFVPGSERGERFLFWPMGIANAGSMRQWGRHATAFVGMRHFDDPNLIGNYFDLP